MTKKELSDRIKYIMWAIYSAGAENGDPVGYRMDLVMTAIDEYVATLPHGSSPQSPRGTDVNNPPNEDK